MNPLGWLTGLNLNLRPVLGAVALLGVAALGVWIALLRADLAAEKAAHQRDIAIWRGAGVQALLKAREQADRIESDQRKVNDDADRRSDSRLNALADGMRAARADHGGTGNAGLPRISISPTVFDWQSGRAIISTDDARICATNTIKLQELVHWYQAQVAIDRNPQ